MTLNQIRYFLALCDDGNFTRAARRCGVSQPSLTNAIRALEQELGGPLFVRQSTVRLSSLGETVRAPFAEILRQIDRVHAAARSAKSNARRARLGTVGAPSGRQD